MFSITLKLKRFEKMLFPFIIRNASDQYKAQEICDRVILENGGTLMFIPDFYKNKKMCNKAIDDYPHALELFSDCLKSQKIRNKASILILLQ